MKITGKPKNERKTFRGHIYLSNGNFDEEKNINYYYKFDMRNNGELDEW